MRTVLLGFLLLSVALAAEPAIEIPIFFFEGRPIQQGIRYVVETPGFSAAFRDRSVVFRAGGREWSIRYRNAQTSRIDALKELPGIVNFFSGSDRSKWRAGLPTYGSIVYRDLYSGIDLHYSAVSRRLKSEFVIAPGADPEMIRMEYSGVRRVWIDANGELALDLVDGEMREQAPVIFQQRDGKRIVISGRYKIAGAGAVGFEIGNYDRSLPLVIDPVVSYSSYLGGSGQTTLAAAAIDNAGNLFAAGWTESVNFPIVGAAQAVNRGGVDAVVVKINSSGSALLYASYLGGRSDDRATGIAVNAAGEAWISGSTASTNFPLAASLRPVLSGSRDAFVTKLSASGNQILFSTYWGGSGYDTGNALRLDSSGNAYVAGNTLSTNFPTQGAAQGSPGGLQDAFVAKFNAAGTLGYSTYLGGSADEQALAIAVDGSGNAYVAGGTTSTNFPTLSAFRATNAGSQDAFVTKVNASGSAWVYSTYLGGNAGTPGLNETANAIAVDAAGNAYVAGTTSSANFPVSSGTIQTGFAGGGNDGFVAKLNPAGNGLVYSTYLGGSAYDQVNGIAIDGTGSALVAGYTASYNFPVSGGLQPAFNGGYDAFVSRLNAAGNVLTFSTLWGGTGSDSANALAIDSGGNMYLAGQTSSIDFPLQGPFQSSNASVISGFVSKLGEVAVAQAPSADSISPESGSGSAQTFTARVSHPAGATTLTTAGILINASLSTSFACTITYDRAANRIYLANDVASSGSTFLTPGSGSISNSQCIVNGSASSATISGNTLILAVSVSFQADFAGAKITYISGTDATSTTGWVAKGSWTATAPVLPQPSADSVSPSSGSGASQTFQFTYSDAANVTNLNGTAALFSTASTVTANACWIVYDRAVNRLSLINDSGTGSATLTPGSGTIQNSQCLVNGSGTSVSLSGNSLILTVAMSFKVAFTGAKTIYLYASGPNGINTGWVARGSWTVSGATGPSADSVSPSSGTESTQAFTFTASDNAGQHLITGVAMLFSTSPTALSNACWLSYDRGANVISLIYDTAGSGSAGLVVGSSGSVENSQCRLNGSGTTVSTVGNSLVVTVSLVFKPAFAGSKNIYLYVAEANGVNTGWVQKGTWTVPGGQSGPTADSVNPSSGSGAVQSFVFTASHTSGVASISGVAMLFSTASTDTVNACWLSYDRGANVISLRYDNPAGGSSSFAIGSSASIENSQCRLSGTGTSVTVSGNSLLITVAMTFKAAFAGTKNSFLYVSSPGGVNTGWVQMGTWTIPSTGPSADSISPSSGSGFTQTFNFVVSSDSGGSAITGVAALFSTSSTATSNACWIVYDPPAGTISLKYDNPAAGGDSRAIGGSTVLANSQCSVGAASAAVNGNSLTLTVGITFKPAFTGLKNSFLFASQPGQNTGWVQNGTWTVP